MSSSNSHSLSRSPEKSPAPGRSPEKSPNRSGLPPTPTKKRVSIAEVSILPGNIQLPAAYGGGEGGGLKSPAVPGTHHKFPNTPLRPYLTLAPVPNMHDGGLHGKAFSASSSPLVPPPHSNYGGGSIPTSPWLGGGMMRQSSSEFLPSTISGSSATMPPTPTIPLPVPQAVANANGAGAAQPAGASNGNSTAGSPPTTRLSSHDSLTEMRNAVLNAAIDHMATTAPLNSGSAEGLSKIPKVDELSDAASRDLLEELVRLMFRPVNDHTSESTTPRAITPSDISSIKSIATRYEVPHTKQLSATVDPETEQFLLNERYVILSTLGKGSQAEVVLSWDMASDAYRAIKVIHMPKKTSQAASSGIAAARKRNEELAEERLQREVAIMKRVRHAHVIRCYEVIEADDRLYFVLQFAGKGAIATVEDSMCCEHPLDADGFTPLARQIAEGLAYIHSLHVVHRDIKPENILVGSDGDAYLADFGVAEIQYAEQCTKESEHGPNGQCWQERARDPTANPVFIQGVTGTPYYLSPELLRNGDADGFASDVWALGVTFSLILTGNFPYAHCIPSDWKEVPDARRKGFLFVEELHRAAESKDDPFPESCTLCKEWRALLSDMLSFDAAKRPPMHKVHRRLHELEFAAAVERNSRKNSAADDESADPAAKNVPAVSVPAPPSDTRPSNVAPESPLNFAITRTEMRGAIQAGSFRVAQLSAPTTPLFVASTPHTAGGRSAWQ